MKKLLVLASFLLAACECEQDELHGHLFTDQKGCAYVLMQSQHSCGAKLVRVQNLECAE